MWLALCLPSIALAYDAHDVVLDGDIVRGKIIESRGTRCRSVMQREAGVVPGAADGLAEDDTLIQRRAVVGALGADREPVGLDVNEKHWLAERVAGGEMAPAHTA